MRFSKSRFWSFVLLLLLPVLLVGMGSIWLLWREQARINERAQETLESRKSAVDARTRLVAENIELLVLDVQSELMNTLHGFQDREDWSALDNLPERNPLVRAVVRKDAGTHNVIAHPEQKAEVLIRWFSGNTVTPPPESSAVEELADFAVSPQSFASYSNAMQVSEVRSQLRQEAQIGNRDIMDSKVDSRSKNAQAMRSRPTEAKRTLASTSMSAAAPMKIEDRLIMDDSASLALAEVADADNEVIIAGDISAPPKQAEAPLGYYANRGDEKTKTYRLKLGKDSSSQQTFSADGHVSGKVSGGMDIDAVMAGMETGASRGSSEWEVQQSADGVHMFAVIKMPDGRGMGLELAMDVLRSRLMGVLPTELAGDERYVLRETKTASNYSGSEWEIRVPLSAGLMPGWEVVGFLTTGKDSLETGSLFFPGMLLVVCLLLFAVLLGGMVLMRQARRSEEEAIKKTSFVANVSHELKTPLTSIRLYTELLEQGRVKDETQRMGYLKTISSEAQRLARLVGNVLDFSRLEQGRKKYSLSELDLGAVVNDLLDTHELRVKDAGLKLHRDISKKEIKIRTDVDAVGQIIINLIENACKYAEEGGEVFVAVRDHEKSVEIIVADRGKGVPAGQRERIFEKFHRVDDRLTSGKTGTGLGLSIARQLARGLGGDLCYEDRKGGGAEFVLTLPK